LKFSQAITKKIDGPRLKKLYHERDKVWYGIQTQTIVIYTNKGTEIKAFVRRPVGKNDTVIENGQQIVLEGTDVPPYVFTNCHGYVFTEGRFWIDSIEIEKILADEYRPAKVEEADIVVFYDHHGRIVHSAVRNPDGTYNSKPGNFPLERGLTLEEVGKGYEAVGEDSYLNYRYFSKE
jgi:hypothetical protein